MISTTEIIDRFQPLLGTVVEIRIELEGADRHDEGSALSDAIANEMLRLQSVLSSVDETSEFRRWSRGEIDEPSSDLTSVLTLASEWRARSDGRFNPAAGALSARWSEAAATGIDPESDELDRLVAELAIPHWDVTDGVVQRRREASDCTLNAIAKGWIADRGVTLAAAIDGLHLVSVNAGGDIAVRGPGTLSVGIEDPFTPFDNAPPLTMIELRESGLATSGGARKWFEVAGFRHSHVLDPRTGRPVAESASISVVAATTAEADALATMLGVVSPSDAIDEAETLDLACLVVGRDGVRYATEAWRSIERSVS